jgi:hypothetical protein
MSLFKIYQNFNNFLNAASVRCTNRRRTGWKNDAKASRTSDWGILPQHQCARDMVNDGLPTRFF